MTPSQRTRCLLTKLVNAPRRKALGTDTRAVAIPPPKLPGRGILRRWPQSRTGQVRAVPGRPPRLGVAVNGPAEAAEIPVAAAAGGDGPRVIAWGRNPN